MTTSAVAERVLEALGDAYRRAAGPLLDPLVDGLTSQLVDVDERVEPTERGWARVFDLDTTTDPAWLGRAIGSKVPGDLTVEQARTFVRERAYWRRGTPTAIAAAVAVLLTGQKRVHLIERDGSPWRLTIRVYTAEVPPGVTAADLKAAASTQKPVGIVVSVDVVAGATFAHMTAEHGPTFADEAADFPTFADATNHLPEEGTIP
ncbi:hypothetical protein ABFU82_22620 [Nocardioides sp. WV_118_6]